MFDEKELKRLLNDHSDYGIAKKVVFIILNEMVDAVIGEEGIFLIKLKDSEGKDKFFYLSEIKQKKEEKKNGNNEEAEKQRTGAGTGDL